MTEPTNPIKCIFYSEFHNIYGTKIFYQYPENYIANEEFEGFAEFIIPKPNLCGKVITFTTQKYKILGYPVLLQDVKYHRNALLFNLAMVFDDKNTDTTVYHNIIRKLGIALRTLEQESEYLFHQSKLSPNIISMSKKKNNYNSNNSSTSSNNNQNNQNILNQSNQISQNNVHNLDQPDLLKVLETLYIELNSYGESTITIDDANTINVKLFSIPLEPMQVHSHHVPVLVDEIDTTNESEWDLTLLQILPHIDGVNYVSRIAKLTEIDIKLVKSCIRHLVYYGVVKMVDIFQYSNIYNPTHEIRKLACDLEMQRACIEYIALPGSSTCSFDTIFALYAALSVDTPFREYCTENELTSLGIDERCFITFGVINGFLLRKQKYPILNNLRLLDKLPTSDKKHLLNGSKSFDEICCILSVGMESVEKLLSEIAEPDSFYIIWK